MEEDFRLLFKDPRQKIIDGIYYELKMIHNMIVDIMVDLKYKPMFEEADDKLEMLEALHKQEDYLLMKLTEEKKVLRMSNN